jgi:hypothetical protein
MAQDFPEHLFAFFIADAFLDCVGKGTAIFHTKQGIRMEQ